MNAGRRAFAPLIKRLAITLVVAAALGMIIQRYAIGKRDDMLMVGLFSAALYAFSSLVMGVINGISNMIYTGSFAVDDMKGAYLAELRARAMPFPGWMDSKRIDYLDRIANDPEESPEDRVKAAYFIGHHRAALSGAGFWGGIALENAANEAVLRYFAEAPESHKTGD